MSKRFLVILFFLLIPWLATPAAAQSDATLTAQAGFDGLYKEGYWVPVTITATNNGPTIEGQLRITVGSSFSDELHYTSPIALPTQSNKQVTIYVLPPNPVSRLKVELLDKQGRLIVDTQTNQLVPLSPSTILYGVVSDEPTSLDFLELVTGTRPEAKVALLDIDQLPEVGPAWNSLDVLILTNVDTGRFTPAQREALQGWLSLGGQLVVTGGSNWQPTTAGIADLLPVTISGSQSLSDLPALSNFTAIPLITPGPYLVATSTLQSGEMLLHEDGLPLLVSHTWDKGHVYFLALDPEAAPLLNWPGQPIIWSKVVADLPILPAWANGPQDVYAAGEAITSLPNLRLPSVIALSAFLLFYTIIIGPVNYFVINRLKRRELAWITIPSIVFFFTILAYLTGFTLRGNQVIVNQMAIVYGQIDGKQVRVNSLIGLYSPRRATYSMTLPNNYLVRPFDHNLGTLIGYGNLEAVSYEDNVSLNGIRVDVSGFETFIAESYRPGPAISGRATLNLNPAVNEIELYVQNNSNDPLKDVGILVGNDYYRVGNLQAGEAQTIFRPLGPSTSSGSYYGSPGLDYTTVFTNSNYFNDPEIFPRYQLLQSLATYSYYSGAGGSTSLLNPGGTAILFAWSDQPQTEIQLSDSTFSKVATTLYLLELPTSQINDNNATIQLPSSVFQRQTLNTNGIYDTSLIDFYMPIGWIEFEYTPWEVFYHMTVSDLSIVLTEPDYGTAQIIPEVKLWHWQQEQWVTLSNITWGETAIANPADYLGPNNSVRLHLQNNDYNGVTIHEVYPLLTGRVP